MIDYEKKIFNDKKKFKNFIQILNLEEYENTRKGNDNMRRILRELTDIVYHGATKAIINFSYDYMGLGNDQFGSGFYFTSDIETAKGYGHIIHSAHLDLNNPLLVDPLTNESKRKIDATYAMVEQLILLAPNYSEKLMDFGDVDYEGEGVVLESAINSYTNMNIVPSILYSLANDFYDDEIELFNMNFLKVTGYDSVEIDFGHSTHYVVFFPYQIQIVDIKDYS